VDRAWAFPLGPPVPDGGSIGMCWRAMRRERFDVRLISAAGIGRFLSQDYWARGTPWLIAARENISGNRGDSPLAGAAAVVITRV